MDACLASGEVGVVTSCAVHHDGHGAGGVCCWRFNVVLQVLLWIMDDERWKTR